MLTKEELSKVIPPQDVIDEIATIVEFTGFTKEKVKNAFYRALALPQLDQFDDIDYRCHQALYIIIAQIKSKQKDDDQQIKQRDNLINSIDPDTLILHTDDYFLDEDDKTCVIIQEECLFIKDEGFSLCNHCCIPEECDKFDNGDDFLEHYRQRKQC